MSLLWYDFYSVNIDEIDNQHKQLINNINNLGDALKNKDEESILKIIESLSEYADTHFKTEEKLFFQYSYPETKSHIIKHKLFIDTIAEARKELKSNRSITNEATTIYNFINRWIIDHICKTDKKYSSFFADKLNR